VDKGVVMNGKLIDTILVAIVVITFFGFAAFHAGIANLIVAYFGAVGLGYYNSLIRHDPQDDSLRPRWQ
jgi:hypothetical protein